MQGYEKGIKDPSPVFHNFLVLMGGDLWAPIKYFHREAWTPGILSQHIRINITYRASSGAPNPHAQVWNKTEKLPSCKTGSCFPYTLCNWFHQCYTSVVSLMGRCYSYHSAFLHYAKYKGCYDSAVAMEGFAASDLNAELPGLNHAWPGWPKNLFLSEVTVHLKPKAFLKQYPPCP